MLLFIFSLVFAASQKCQAEIIVISPQDNQLKQIVSLIDQYPSIIINGTLDENAYRAINNYIINQFKLIFTASQSNTSAMESISSLLIRFNDSLELYKYKNELIAASAAKPSPANIYSHYSKNKVKNSVAKILALNS